MSDHEIGANQLGGRAERASVTDTKVDVSGHSEQPTGQMSVVEPALEELAEALERNVDADGAVPAGIARRLRQGNGWSGRLVDILEVVTESAETMGYLAGGRRPGEVATWLSPWAQSPLSIEDIRLVIACGGWDPEPFSVLARAGFLKALLLRSDGSPRRIRGELAGGWASDEFALADDEEIVRRVRDLVEAGDSSPPA